MRQKLGLKKVKQLRKQTGLDIVAVLVRGNTNHRKDLCLRDKTVIHLFRDGQMAKSKYGHGMEPML